MASTTVTIVISREFPREFQKSVTFIASVKFEKLQEDGRESAPAISFVISDGFLKAITTAIYNGKKIVTHPRIKRIVTGQLVLPGI